MLSCRRFPSRLLVLSCVLALSACDDGPILIDADAGADGATPMHDGGPIDASSFDGGPLPDPDGGTDGGTDAGTDAGPPCEELDPTAPIDPAGGAWLAEFNNPGVGGGTGLRPGVGAFAFGADGNLYVGGNFTTAGYVSVSNVAAWHPASGWRALGDGLPMAVSHLTFGADGSLYAVHGQPGSSTAYRISRWDGTSWSTFADADGAIAELDAVGDRLIAVGSFTEIGGASHTGVAYYDGAAWQGYGLAPNRGVQTVSATGPDDVCIGGQFNTLGVIEAQNIACWNGSTWEARSLPLAPPETPSFPPRPGVWNIGDLQRDPADGSLVAGGNFRLDESETTGGGIARWTGSAWELIGGGVMEYGPGGTGNVLGIAITPSGLYIGGAFRFANASMDPLTEVNDAARWDGTRWHPMASGLFAESGFGIGARPAAAGVVAATPDGGSVFFGGTMNRADTMSVGGVVRWDGTYWRGLRAAGERYYGLSGEARAFARRGTCEVYVGGDFIYAGEVRANSIARFTREGGYEALGDGVLGTVESIEVTREGLVYAAGNFVDESGTVLRNLAVWDGTEWVSVGGGVGDPTDATETVRALAIGEGRGPDGADLVYVAGHFTSAGGERSSGFAMWNGSAWTDLGAGMRGHEIPTIPGNYADPRVTALLVDPDTGDLIVTGSFTAIGENDQHIETTNIARWDGSAWHAFGDGAGSAESPIISATLWSGRVAIARQFVNDDPLRFAVWTGTEWEAIGTDQPGYTIPSAIDGIGDSLFVAGGWADGRHAAVFDGTGWHPLGDGTSDGTSAVLAIEGGVLYGGAFNRAGDTGSGGIGFWQYPE